MNASPSPHNAGRVRLRLAPIGTHHATQLGITAATGEMVHAPAGADGVVPLVLAVFAGRRDVGVLLPLDAIATPIWCGGNVLPRGGIPLFLEPAAGGGLGLCLAGGDRLLCAIPEAPGRGASLDFNRSEIGIWETFTPLDTAPDGRLDGIAARLAPLAGLLARGLTGQSLLAALQTQGSGIDPWLEVAGRLLPLDQADWFGAQLLGAAQACVRLQLALTDDPWISVALPDLITWLANRDAPRAQIRRVPCSLDDINDRLMDDARTSFGMNAVVAARRSVQPRRNLCVLATARNEGVYLLDWLAYHRAIGVEAFFLYSNSNDDGSDDLLRLLAEAGEITWFNNEVGPGVVPQFKAYAHALSMIPEVLDYRWTACIDLDEFIGFDTTRFASLIDFLRFIDHRPTDAVGLCWLMFGSHGDIAWHDAPLWERFHQHEMGVNPHVKSIFRSNRFATSRCHHPHTRFEQPFIFRGEAGGMHHRTGDPLDPSFSAQPRADLAWIAHYYWKSASEFAWKKSRNAGDHPTRGYTQPALIDSLSARWFVDQHRHYTMERDDRLLSCAHGAAVEKARLLALPGVAACEAHLKQIFTTRIAAIVDQFRQQTMPDEERNEFAQLFR